MNFGVGKKYSVFLMSVGEGAPYADAIDPVTGMLEYEGMTSRSAKADQTLKKWTNH
jgi:hypothetical protein